MGWPQPTSGTGSATISISFVSANTSSSPHEEIFVFGGRPLTLTQQVNTCKYTFSAITPQLIPANGGAGTFTVNASGTPCPYYTFPGDGVTITSGATGNTFPATVGFSVSPNADHFGSGVTRWVNVSPTPTPGFGSGVTIEQNGTPVSTDWPWKGIAFAVHRANAGSPYVSTPEPFRITNAEDPTASWTATASQPWLVVTPLSGTSPSTASVWIDRAAVALLTPGFYGGEIRIVSSVAPSTPRLLGVQLRITDATTTTYAPFGVLDIPRHGTVGLSGAVPVGGWAADDVGIARVQIFRNSVAGEPAGEIYLGDGTRVRGARPDVSNGFSAPGVTSAGWGLMVLSNVLPNGGNGTFTLTAYAEDIEGKPQFLGRTTVTFDNTSSPFPFGTIDVPGQGATVSGTLANQGWILAQPGRSISADGSTIRLFIDGVERPDVASYGHARPDVFALFPYPTYVNANGPALQFSLNTTPLTDGLHTIVWVVRDDVGTIQGIGSRFFNVQNGSASQSTGPQTLEARSAAEVRALPQAVGAVLWERRGLDEGSWSLRFAGRATPDAFAVRGERVEVALDAWWWPKACGPYAAYLISGDVAGPLPPGASFDDKTGIFRWQPPIEFSGAHDFVFVRQSCAGREERVAMRVVID
jgi:hypothetical protein